MNLQVINYGFKHQSKKEIQVESRLSDNEVVVSCQSLNDLEEYEFGDEENKNLLMNSAHPPVVLKEVRCIAKENWDPQNYK